MLSKNANNMLGVLKMIELIQNFDIKPYLNEFKKNNFYIQTLVDIENIYSSKEYSQFITNLYEFFNQQSIDHEEKSGHNHCIAVKKVIDQFWSLMLGADLIRKYSNCLKKNRNSAKV